MPLTSTTSRVLTGRGRVMSCKHPMGLWCRAAGNTPSTFPLKPGSALVGEPTAGRSCPSSGHRTVKGKEKHVPRP